MAAATSSTRFGCAISAGAQSPPPIDEELSCCEYVSAGGEVKSVLQLFCACEDVDGIVDDLFRGRGANPDRFDRALADIDDRIRVPWPFGDAGALHLGLPGLLPPCLLILAAVAASSSFVALVIVAMGVPFFACLMHSRLMRLRRRNGFFLSWTLTSMTLCSISYMSRFADAIPPEANILNIAFVGASVASLAGAMSGPAILPESADEEARCAARANRCAMTGAVVVGYDHYCTWVGASIGAGNHRAYFSFVTMMGVMCISASICIASWVELCQGQGQARGFVAGVADCFLKNQSSFALAYVVYLQIVTVGVGALLLHQTLLISQGVTSYERRHRSRLTYLQAHDSLGRGFAKNWLDFLRGSRSDLGALRLQPEAAKVGAATGYEDVEGIKKHP